MIEGVGSGDGVSICHLMSKGWLNNVKAGCLPVVLCRNSSDKFVTESTG